MKLSSILGLNARSQLFSYLYNKPDGKKVAASKILTHKVLSGAGIPTPEIYKKFKNPNEIFNFDWSTIPDSFALKPSKGLGGEGIIVIKKRSEDSNGPGQVAWITTQREKVTPDDLKLHALDIVEGAFSWSNAPDVAFVQEYVGRHKAFRKYAFRGTPDIRIIVFNKVPIMAMLRLPTRESSGRANLHQGAIGVGVDISTGITTRAIWHGEQIVYKPGTKRKLRGIKIPDWTGILEMAVRCQEVSGLGYVGVDIVIHPEKGPMVLELNAHPGLQIQFANLAGLKKRLERVEDLDVIDAEHGVRIAKALFASPFSDRVRGDEGVISIGIFEEVKIKGENGKKIIVKAKIDTGAKRTSLDRDITENLGLLNEKNILWTRRVKSSLGKETRPVIGITFWLKGRKIITTAGVANRRNLKFPMIIGRKDLSGFLVNPQTTYEVS